jgi:hypothetical protein
MSDNFFEAQINTLNFRYTGGNIIEVSKVNDKHHTVLHEIWINELTSKKDFEKEISFWYMSEGVNY